MANIIYCPSFVIRLPRIIGFTEARAKRGRFGDSIIRTASKARVSIISDLIYFLVSSNMPADLECLKLTVLVIELAGRLVVVDI